MREVCDFTDTLGLPYVVGLMERYANVPMDFADATLVLLAEMIDAIDVLTLDRRGFATHRAPRARSRDHGGMARRERRRR